MKFPIIVNEHGDLMLFYSEDSMSDYLEPIDVKNDEYEVYDSEGNQYKLIVESSESNSKFIGRSVSELVRLGEKKSSDPDKLALLVSAFLEQVDQPVEGPNLSEKISKLEAVLS